MSTATDSSSLADRLRSVQVGVRSELEVSRHVFCGAAAYVIRDPISFKSHRLSAADYQVFLAITANETLGTTFLHLCEKQRLLPEQEEDFYRFVLSLNQLGLLSLPVNHANSLYERYRRRLAQERRARWLGVLFLRVPLLQPDQFLDRTMHRVSPLFTRGAFIVWLMFLAVTAAILWVRWQDFRSPLGTILTLQNLPTLWTLLVCLKIVHEFGHAYACKHFGGRVPEMGAYFIIFTPCAYVDASASWGFPSRLQRVIVGLGGMYFESIVAMLAVIVWSLTSAGPIHSAAQYVIVLSSVITIGFNANPLMKYDGYYVLSDLTGIPNLRSEAQQRFNAIVRWLWLGTSSGTQQEPFGRQIFLIAFGLLSSLYKGLVVLGIALAIAFKIPTVGLLIASAYCLSLVRRTIGTLRQEIRRIASWRMRARAAVISLVACVGILGFLLTIPVPHSARVLGVVGSEVEQVVHAGASGFLLTADVQEGDPVHAGQSLCLLDNRQLLTSMVVHEQKIHELKVQQQDLLRRSPAEAAMLGEQIKQAEHDYEETRAAVDKMVVTAPTSGRLIDAEPIAVSGQFIRRGEPLGTIVDGGWVVRTVATAEDFSAARPTVGDPVRIRFLAAANHVVAGRVVQVAGTGRSRIDELSLTHLGGGTIAVEGETLEAAQPYFQILIELDPSGETKAMLRQGMRGWIQFSKKRQCFGPLLYRRGLSLLHQLQLAR